MSPSASTRRTLVGLAVVAALVAGSAIGISQWTRWRRSHRLPGAGSPAYEGLVRHFYHGLAALEVGLLDDARTQFEQATTAAPGEPATWADLGITLVRLGELDAADQAIRRAVALAPRNGDVALVHGQIDAFRGKTDSAVADFQHAIDLNPRSVRAKYALADTVESSGTPDAEPRAKMLFDDLARAEPSNLVILLEQARLAAKLGDAAGVRGTIEHLRAGAAGWPAAAATQLTAIEQASAAQNFAAAATALAVLRNVLLRTTDYQEALAQIRTPADQIARPFDRFLRLPPPVDSPAPLDAGFTLSSTPTSDGDPASMALAIPLDETSRPTMFAVEGDQLRELGGPRRSWTMDVTPTSGAGIVALDWNRDFKSDLAVAGRGGVRLFLQGDNGGFEDVTARTARGAMIDADCFGVWTADVEMDGDLDLVVGVAGDHPVVLRNNGDGTWQTEHPFDAVTGARAFAWGDIDGDGDPDALMIDAAGRLHVFENRQSGVFRPMPAPANLGRALAVAVGDVDGDGTLDAVVLEASGAIRRLERRDGNWDVRDLATWPDAVQGSPGDYRLLLADLDNNGALDLVVSGNGGTRVWLSDERHRLRPLDAEVGAQIFDLADLNGDGWLDAVGVAARSAGLAAGPRHARLPLAAAPAPRPAVGRRSADQLVRHRRRGPGPFGTAHADAAHLEPARALRSRDGSARGRRACRLAERRHAGRLRRRHRPGHRGRSAPQGLLSVGLRRQRDRLPLRDRLSVAISSRAADQRAGDRRRLANGGLGEDPRRPAGAEERIGTTSGLPPNCGRRTSSTTSR